MDGLSHGTLQCDIPHEKSYAFILPESTLSPGQHRSRVFLYQVVLPGISRPGSFEVRDLFVGELVVGGWGDRGYGQPGPDGEANGRDLSRFRADILFRSIGDSVRCADRPVQGSVGTVSLLALLGLYEFFAGHAGAGILVNVLIETLLAGAYVWVLVTERRPIPPA